MTPLSACARVLFHTVGAYIATRDNWRRFRFDVEWMRDEPTLQAADIAAYELNKLALKVAARGSFELDESEFGNGDDLMPSGSRNILLSFVNHLPPVTQKFFGDSKGLPVVVQIPGLS
jgi:hypothetical protein